MMTSDTPPPAWPADVGSASDRTCYVSETTHHPSFTENKASRREAFCCSTNTQSALPVAPAPPASCGPVSPPLTRETSRPLGIPTGKQLRQLSVTEGSPRSGLGGHAPSTQQGPRDVLSRGLWGHRGGLSSSPGTSGGRGHPVHLWFGGEGWEHTPVGAASTLKERTHRATGLGAEFTFTFPD